jgi:hypothetical protein
MRKRKTYSILTKNEIKSKLRPDVFVIVGFSALIANSFVLYFVPDLIKSAQVILAAFISLFVSEFVD